jgi:hypothetical protein
VFCELFKDARAMVTEKQQPAMQLVLAGGNKTWEPPHEGRVTLTVRDGR